MWQVGATLCRGARASHCCGFSGCRAQASGAQASVVVATGLAALQHVQSSQVMDQTRALGTGRLILIHCTTREVLKPSSYHCDLLTQWMIKPKCYHVRILVAVQSLSRVHSVTLWTAARQASLSSAISRSLPKLMFIESVMPSNYLILCHPLLLPQSFPASGSFSMSRLFTSSNQSIGAS